MTAAGRLAEMLISQGLGASLEQESLHFLPLAVCTYMDEDFSEWKLAVFLWEALTAILLLIFALRLRRRFKRPGALAERILVLLSCAQILLEQFRQDDYVSFARFVRFSQLAGIATVVVITALRMRREIARDGWTIWQKLRFPLMILGSLVVIFAEFVFDKPQYLMALRLSMALTAVLAAIIWLRRESRGAGISRYAALGCMLAVTLACILLLGRDLAWESLILYLSMAMGLAAVAAGALMKPWTVR